MAAPPAARSPSINWQAALIERERGNPRFAFLTAVLSPEHGYYRWRAWAAAQGSTPTPGPKTAWRCILVHTSGGHARMAGDTSLERWREDPFVMTIGGPTIHPPRVMMAGAAGRGGSARDRRRGQRSTSRSRSRGTCFGACFDSLSRSTIPNLSWLHGATLRGSTAPRPQVLLPVPVPIPVPIPL